MADRELCRHNDEVIITKLEALERLNEEQHNSIHTTSQAILEQTLKTNGRVTKLEEKVTKIEDWKSKIIGGLFFSQILILPITISLIIWAITKS